MIGRRQQLEVLRRCEERLRQDRVGAMERLSGRGGTAGRGAGTTGARGIRTAGSVIAGLVRRDPETVAGSDRAAEAEVRRRRRRLAKAGRALRSASPPSAGRGRPSGEPSGGGELAQLLLRAYDDVAAACGRDLPGTGLAAALDRLDRAVDVIDRIGSAMAVRVAPAYHALRRRELELAAGAPAAVSGRAAPSAPPPGPAAP
ncbi:hypothetical protein AHOG_13085 [Actinoalloteichus hoggarensis]|uniref:SNIPE associated domain-containing protein n=1 Tax=Actinoalloteichus hoggarensis TaxID=1470176 RepID=A0A221W351_9PSEU|nr:hypothetical protein AHOG_13085 [Actinoalloteichus hoggarensis]